jgi:hypothetical protein
LFLKRLTKKRRFRCGEEVTIEEMTVETTMIERVTVSEHYLAVEYVPERRARREHDAGDVDVEQP